MTIFICLFDRWSVKTTKFLGKRKAMSSPRDQQETPSTNKVRRSTRNKARADLSDDDDNEYENNNRDDEDEDDDEEIAYEDGQKRGLKDMGMDIDVGKIKGRYITKKGISFHVINFIKDKFDKFWLL